MQLRQKQCRDCPFRPDGARLRENAMDRIYGYLLEGVNHICHNTTDSVCVGGREWQLEIWYRLGRIKAPTNEALAEAMRAAGVEPKEHIC